MGNAVGKTEAECVDPTAEPKKNTMSRVKANQTSRAISLVRHLVRPDVWAHPDI